jgi:hypothetical protein
MNCFHVCPVFGWCISSCGFLTLPNNLFFTHSNNQSIMYSPPLFTTASQRSGRFSIPRLKKSSGLAVKKPSSQFWRRCWRKLRCAQIVGERERAEEVVIRWGKVRRVGRMWKNLPVEFLNGRFRHVCSVWSGVVMLKYHSMSSSRAFLLDCFLQTANLLTVAFGSDGQFLSSSS